MQRKFITFSANSSFGAHSTHRNAFGGKNGNLYGDLYGNLVNLVVLKCRKARIFVQKPVNVQEFVEHALLFVIIVVILA